MLHNEPTKTFNNRSTTPTLTPIILPPKVPPFRPPPPPGQPTTPGFFDPYAPGGGIPASPVQPTKPVPAPTKPAPAAPSEPSLPSEPAPAPAPTKPGFDPYAPGGGPPASVPAPTKPAPAAPSEPSPPSKPAPVPASTKPGFDPYAPGGGPGPRSGSRADAASQLMRATRPEHVAELQQSEAATTKPPPSAMMTPTEYREIINTGEIVGTPQPTTDPDKFIVRIRVPGTNRTISATLSRAEVMKRAYVRVNIDNPYQPEYVLKSDYEKLEAESPNLADVLKHKGTVAVSADIKNINERQEADIAVWERDVLSNMSPEYQAAYKKGGSAELKRLYERNVLPSMPKEYREAYSKGDKTGLARLEAQYKTEYASWLKTNIRDDKYLNGIYANKGEQEAINAWVKRQADLAGIAERQDARFKAAQKEMAPYASIDMMQLMRANRPEHVTELLQKQTYNIRGFLYEYPYYSSITTLKIMGFSKETTKDAKAYVDAVQQTIAEINKNPKTWDDKFSHNSVAQIQADNLGLITRGRPGILYPGEKNHGILYRGPAMIGDFDVFWENLTTSEKARLVGSINADPNRSNDFAAVMERVNRSYDNLPTALQFTIPFTPYVGMPFLAAKSIGTTIQKRVTGLKVERMEYAIDAATATLAVVPYVGGLLEKGMGITSRTLLAKSPGIAEKIAGKNLGGVTPKILRMRAGEIIGAAGSKLATQGLTAGSMGIFIANLADTWDSMTAGERATNLGILMLPFTGVAIRKLQFLKTLTRDDYVPLRSMSTEASTARVEFTDAQIAKMKEAGYTEADIIKAGDSINEQLASRAKKAVINIGPEKIVVKNVPYQQIMGHSIFQGTPDVTQLGRGGSVPLREFYAAAKVAIEPMQRSYLSGQRAVHPGIIEIRINDPAILKEIGPQRRLIAGGKTLEPEIVLPSLDSLQGKGYRLEPIPGKNGTGYTFDESLGELQIRRFTLTKVTGNESGLLQVKTGKTGDGGTVGVGDLHATNKFKDIFDDVNNAFDKPVIEGNPNYPDTWHITKGSTGRTILFLGDTIDRGTEYLTWRRNINRLANEASVNGDRVASLLGNHELAYISGEAIKGITYTDKAREPIKKGIIEDINNGTVLAAAASEGKLYTHAGVSKRLFPEFRRKSPEYIANAFNKKLLEAVKTDNFDDKMFATGRVEKGNYSSRNELSQGGPFWLRPQEATPAQLDLGFPQIVGHNPGFAVRRIWGGNFIETDVGRRSGGVGVYADTPAVKTVPVDIITTPIKGSSELSNAVKNQLKIRAMADTVTDVFLGWDGRIKAVRNLVENRKQVEALIKSIEKQIEERRAAGDSVGMRYLERQKEDLINPEARDYLYGGIGLWRDLVMGRQNSVKVLDNFARRTPVNKAQTIAMINTARNKINSQPGSVIKDIFGYDKAEINRRLSTEELASYDTPRFNEQVIDRLNYLREIIDNGLERAVVPYLDREKVIDGYSRRLQSAYTDLRKNEGIYDLETGRLTTRTPGRETEGLRGAEPQTSRSPSENIPSRTPLASPPDRTPAPLPPGRPPTLPPPPIRVSPPPGRTPPPPPPEPPKIPPHPPRSAIAGSTKKGSWTPGEIQASVAFQMGELIKDGKRVWNPKEEKFKIVGGKKLPVIIARKPPYRDVDSRVFVGDIPKGMKIHPDRASAYKSIQLLGKQISPVEFTGKQGFARFTVRNPETSPGKPGAIAFGKPDVKPEDKSKKPAEINQVSDKPFKINRPAAAGDKLTAGGFFLSTGAQEFSTPKTSAGSMAAARPIPVLKRNVIPVKRSFATPDVIAVSRFNADTIVRIDKAPVRPLDFANASAIPERLARRIQEYAKEHNGVLYGSLNAYTKLENAPRPHDVDLAFKNRANAQKDILKLAEAAGFQAKPGLPHSIKILKEGKWEEIIDIDSVSHHKTLLPPGLSQQVLTKIDGIDTETLGEQYLRQSYGASSGSKKAPQRAEHIKQAAAEVKKMLMLAGARARGDTHRTDIRTNERFHDPTRKIAKQLSGGDFSKMRNVSSRKSGQFRTRVNGGTLISAVPIRGR